MGNVKAMQHLHDQLQTKLRRQTEAVENTTLQLEDVRALIEHNNKK